MMHILADVNRETSDFTYEYFYQLNLVKSVSIDTKEDQTTLPLPGTPADDSFIMAFQGESKEINLNFTIYNNGDNKAYDTIDDSNSAPTGVYSDDTVKTINEQIDYLENYIKKPSVDARHRIVGGPFSAGTKDFIEGRLIQVNPERESQSPAHCNCSLRFVVGNVL